MENNNAKVLVLGANGMVGRTVFEYLIKNDISTFGSIRQKSTSHKFQFIFPEQKLILKNYINENNIKYIINCIGILKNSQNTNYKLNYLLPKFLQKINEKNKFKIINISTDDVFPTNLSNTNEENKTKPNNEYGKSKLKGELTNVNIINIRSSFLGFDPYEKKGLIEFVRKNHDNQINGYINQTWSGCTTLQFAKFCKFLVINNNFINLREKTSIVHFAPLGPLNKYDLLISISEVLNINIKIKPYMSTPINRYLDSIYFDKNDLDQYTTNINKAIRELKQFENEFI